MNLTTNKPESIWSSLLLIAPFFLWGSAMVAMKGVIDETTPFFLAGVRLVPAGILVVIVAMILGRSQPQGWKAWLWIGLFALLDGAMFQGFLAQGLLRTNAGLGSVMIDSQPLAVALMSSWLFGEVIGLWGWLGLGLGILGISLLGLPTDWWLSWAERLSVSGLDLSGLSLLESLRWGALFSNGQWLMLLASLSMATGTIVIRYVSRYTDPVMATGWHMILGGIPLFIFSGLWEQEQWIHIVPSGWLALAYSTVFGSAIAYGIFFYLASKGNLTSLSSLTFLTPVFALTFGTLFLSEVLQPLQWGGVALTLVSIYLINQRETLTDNVRSLLGRMGLAGLIKTESEG